MQKKFAVQTSIYSGVGDQIGTQFATLYRLGLALGYEYTHIIPFQFPRSYYTSYLERLAKRVLTLIRVISKSRINLRLPTKNLAIFLGIGDLDLSQKGSQTGFELLDANLNQIIQTDISTLPELKTEIEKTASSASPESILLLKWTPGMHSHIPKLHQILGCDYGNNDDINRFFSQRYWQARESWKIPLLFDRAADRLRVTVHIRLGDSTAVEVGGKELHVHDNNVHFISSEYASVLAIDPNRMPIQVAKYTAFLEQLFSKLGEENIHCIVISDGYEATFRTIKSAHQKGHLDLTSEELRQLPYIKQKLNRQLQEQFENHKNISTIIGETNSNLFKSIHALASADVVIFGTGGFAFFMHHLLKKPWMQSVAISIREYSDEVFGEIERLLTERSHQE